MLRAAGDNPAADPRVDRCRDQVLEVGIVEDFLNCSATLDVGAMFLETVLVSALWRFEKVPKFPRFYQECSKRSLEIPGLIKTCRIQVNSNTKEFPLIYLIFS